MLPNLLYPASICTSTIPVHKFINHVHNYFQMDHPGCCETRCCFPFKHSARNPELGILLFQDITKIKGKNFRCLKKIEIPSLEHAKMAFE